MDDTRLALLAHTKCLLIALEERDAYTDGHCSRVEGLCMQIGIEHGMNDEDLALLWSAARLHDVGKIGIPDRILLKPGNFDQDEWEIMNSHAALGERICSVMPHENADLVSTFVRHHHESFDGTGYPDALVGTQIPIFSRIISVADCYDAMTTTRPYHSPRSHAEVMTILRDECGKKIDPDIFEVFAKVIVTSEFKANCSD
jgi:HD-GYP domain-containing protein (c-di-GMP phosphodiesterase class II)